MRIREHDKENKSNLWNYLKKIKNLTVFFQKIKKMKNIDIFLRICKTYCILLFFLLQYAYKLKKSGAFCNVERNEIGK